ncbi:MAG: hypothetical protein AB2L11_10620 [Syntrophobacteraceae bacterium]
MNALILYQSITAVFFVAVVFTSGLFVGYRRSARKYEAQSVSDREEMLTIERSLKQFWDHEKEKLQGEKNELQRKINFLEERLDQYRRKAAGIGMMGLRKSKLTDMLISLLMENETLEEKLFLQNMKLKEERDEFLKNEMRHISYKRVLLSELINQSEVRRELDRAISDKGTWKRLQFKQKDLGPMVADVLEEDEATEENTFGDSDERMS